MRERLLRARRSVFCIITTNVAPRELLWRPNKRTRFGMMGPSSLWHEQITDHCLDFGFEDHDDRVCAVKTKSGRIGDEVRRGLRVI